MIAPKVRPFGLSILAVVALAGAGCGESEAESARDDVESAVKEFAAALKDKDYDKACDSITDGSRELVESQGKGGAKCPEILKQQPAEDIPDDIEVDSVEISENATVRIKGQDRPAKLKKEGDEWKFDLGGQQ